MNELWRDNATDTPDDNAAAPAAAEKEHPWSVSDDDDGSDVSLPLSAHGADSLSEHYEQQRRWIEDGVPIGPAPQPEQPPEPQPVQPLREIPPDQGFTVRAITEAAMMIAISVVLALVSTYVPVLNILGILLYPLPVAILCLRRGLRVSVAATVALLGLSAIFLGVAQAALMLIQYGALGLFLGYCFRSRRQPLFTLCVASVIAAVGTTLALLLSTFVSGLPLSAIYDQLNIMITEYADYMIDYGGANFFAARGWTQESFIAEAQEMMARLLPGMFAIFGMGLTMITYIIMVKVLRRMRYDILALPKFITWRVNWRIAWGVIAGLALQFCGRYFGLELMQSIGGNILYIICPILFVTGLAFAVWYAKNIISQLWIKVLLVLLGLQFITLSFYIVMFISVLDGIYDLRPLSLQRKKRRDEQRQSCGR